MKNNRCVKVPIVIQMEVTECGAACLDMILAYHKKWIPLEVIRADCGVSRDGSNAKNIIKAARMHGLDAKVYRAEINYLKNKVSLPCIIHWNFNHFVVLCGFIKNKAIINDPAKGRYLVSPEELDKAFTGICMTFAPTEAFVPSGKPKSVWDFAKTKLSENKSAFILIALATAALSIMEIAIPGFANMFTDEILVGKNTSYLYPFTYALGFIIFIKLVTECIKEIYSYKINGKIEIVASSRYIWHIIRLPMDFFSQRMAGDIQGRKRKNSEVVYRFIMIFAPLFIKCAMMLFYLAVMVRYSLILSLAGVLSVLINSAVSVGISKKRIDLARVISRDEGNLNSATVSGIEMIETIKSNGAENGFFEKWSGYQACVNNSEVTLDKLNVYLGIIPQIIRVMANAFIFMGSVYLCMNGAWTVGMITAFSGLLTSFLEPVSDVIDMAQDFFEMRTDMERIEDIMEYPTETIGKESDDFENEDFNKLTGNIEIRNATFGYSKLGEPVIKDFSMTVKPGQRVAIVGGSGSGKSTAAKLISGLYEAWSGEILFDGKPISQINRNVFTGSVAVVDQDIILFEDTVSNNIKMWDSSIEDFEMILAARDAQIHEAIVQREGGYQYKLAEGDANLSGGESQRLEIARVLAGDPTIIIMDEATSALDAKTEFNVVQSICNRGITCIVVAHRLSTIKDCDEIIVLDKGEIAERGTHEELYALNGLYTRLVTNE